MGGRLGLGTGFLGEEWLLVWLTSGGGVLRGQLGAGQRKREKQGGVKAKRSEEEAARRRFK